jgi:type I restriction enzyme, S subunit
MKSIKLAELFSYTKGKPPRQSSLGGRELPYLNPEYLRGKSGAELVTVTSSVVTVDDKDLILLWDGSNSGEFFMGRRGVLASTMVLLGFDKSKIEKDYLYYHLKHIEPYLKAQTSGSGIPHVDKEVLGNIKIVLHKKDEQKKIAEVLTQVDNAITQTEALIAKYGCIRTGLMQDLLTKGIDEQGRIRSEVTHTFKDSPLGRVPLEWDVVHLVDHMTLPSGQVIPTQEQYIDLPLIAPDHIESNTGRLLKLETARIQGAISGKYLFSAGDVIYSKIRPYLRKAVLANRKGLCSADMYPLKPKQTLEPRFLLEILLGENFTRFAITVSERSGIPKMNRKELSEYVLALPKREEQKLIVNVIENNDKLLDIETSKVDKLKRIKTALMQDLLTGDKPVDALLEQVESKQLEVTA